MTPVTIATTTTAATTTISNLPLLTMHNTCKKDKQQGGAVEVELHRGE
jgi:hypothetical protein